MEKKYLHTVIASDIVIFTIDNDQLKVLLIKMQKHPFGGQWAAPGGLVGPEESIDIAAKRHLLEKTGIRDIYMEQLFTFGEVERDPFGRVASVSYFALLPSGNKTHMIQTSSEYIDIRWFNVQHLPELAYDHKEMIHVAVERLQGKLGYTNIICNLMPKGFPLRDLKKAYEIILNKELDKGNFRRKIMSLDIIEDSGEKTLSPSGPRASLFQFKEKTLKIIQFFK